MLGDIIRRGWRRTYGIPFLDMHTDYLVFSKVGEKRANAPKPLAIKSENKEIALKLVEEGHYDFTYVPAHTKDQNFYGSNEESIQEKIRAILGLFKEDVHNPSPEQSPPQP